MFAHPYAHLLPLYFYISLLSFAFSRAFSNFFFFRLVRSKTPLIVYIQRALLAKKNCLSEVKKGRGWLRSTVGMEAKIR